MAKGTNLIFNKTSNYIVTGAVDIISDTWKAALISNSVTSLLVSDVSAQLGATNLTEVAAGGGYVSGGKTLTLANVSASSVFTMALATATHSSGKIVWSAEPSSPTNIRTAVIYDATTVSPTAAAVCYVDLTEDGGTTAIDLTARNIEVNFGSSGNPGHILRIKTSN